MRYRCSVASYIIFGLSATLGDDISQLWYAHCYSHSRQSTPSEVDPGYLESACSLPVCPVPSILNPGQALTGPRRSPENIRPVFGLLESTGIIISSFVESSSSMAMTLRRLRPKCSTYRLVPEYPRSTAAKLGPIHGELLTRTSISLERHLWSR